MTVVDFMLFDRTGVVLVSLWDRTAEEFVRIVGLQPDGPRHLVEIKTLRSVPFPKPEWNGVSIPNINMIKSVTSLDERFATQVRKCRAPQSPYNQPSTEFLVPQALVALHQYQSLRSHPLPFRGTFVGTITDVDEID